MPNNHKLVVMTCNLKTIYKPTKKAKQSKTYDRTELSSNPEVKEDYITFLADRLAVIPPNK